jgi:hypothetical protein
MIWPVAFFCAALLGIFAAEVEARIALPPELVIVCEKGGVAPNESHLASGSTCVLHDRNGSAASAGSISVYSDEMAVP